MSLTGKYELGTPVSEIAAAFDKSIEGRQVSTGRPIAVHLLAGGYNPENQTLLREIAALPPEYKACFLESGDHYGTPYIVTDSLAGAPPFRKWFASLQARQSGSGKEPADLGHVRAWQIPVRVSSQTPAPPVKPPAAFDPGEATQLIEIPGFSPEPPPPAKAPTREPGEFTRMMQISSVKVEAPPEVEAPRGSSCVSGEFTQMFQTQVPEPVVPPIVPPKAEEHQPGEFTQFFKAVTPEPAAPPPKPPPPPPVRPAPPNAEATILFQVPQPAPAAPAVPKPVPPSSAPGEFTQMFAPAPRREEPARGSQEFDDLFRDSHRPAEPVANSPQPGEFTRMMESPLARAGLKPQPYAPPAPASLKPADSHEFTRMLESPVSSQSEAPSSPAPSRQGKPSGDATRAFRVPEAPPPPAPAAPAPPAGPSEFTQMFKAPAKEVEPQPVKAPVKQQRVIPRKKPNTAYLKWILIASGVLLIIAVIVYFAVRD